MILEHRGYAGIAWCSFRKPHWGLKRAERGSRATFWLRLLCNVEFIAKTSLKVGRFEEHVFLTTESAAVDPRWDIQYPYKIRSDTSQIQLTQELTVTDCTRCMNCWITFRLWSAGLWQDSTVKMEAASFSESLVSAYITIRCHTL
jgi:hypothetical protein